MVTILSPIFRADWKSSDLLLSTPHGEEDYEIEDRQDHGKRQELNEQARLPGSRLSHGDDEGTFPLVTINSPPLSPPRGRSQLRNRGDEQAPAWSNGDTHTRRSHLPPAGERLVEGLPERFERAERYSLTNLPHSVKVKV